VNIAVLLPRLSSRRPGNSWGLARALIGLALSVVWTWADRVVPFSIEQLTQRSEVILHGKVLSKNCLRDSAGRIYTRLEVAVSEVWKGEAGRNPFIIVHGGGMLGEETVAVSDQVNYSVGEEVVAFLRLNDRNEGVTLSLSQGKFRVAADPQTGQKFVASPFHGASPRPQNATFTPLNDKAAARPAVLQFPDFRARVMGWARSQRALSSPAAIPLEQSNARKVAMLLGNPAAFLSAGW